MSTHLSPPVQSRRPNRAAARTIAALTAALGVGVVVVSMWAGAAPTVAASLTHDETRQLAVDGVTELSLDVAASAFVVRFDDVDEASLAVENFSGDSWTFEREGDQLRVTTPNRWFGWGGWWTGGSNTAAELVLPRSLEGVDVDADAGAGSLTADGEFGDFSLDLGAGDATLVGSATDLDLVVGAGRADVDLEGVRAASFELNAGDAEARLSGVTPSEVEIEVGAGSLDLTLPDDEYAVTSDVSAGDLDNGLRTSPASRHIVHADISAGSVRLIAG